jgi:L,D-peptidoglycan transpeptidase YkuD (ErfK/YbiS/YcfS/YnhG family)
MSLRTGSFPAVALAVAGLLLTGCAGDTGKVAPAAANVSPSASAVGRPGPGRHSGPEALAGRAREIPSLGPGIRAEITPANRQAVVVVGQGPDSNRSVAVLYERDPVLGWRPVSGTWPAHNGLLGWTDDHEAGDRRSPIGVFGLTDAGGRLPNPGTRLPYDEGPDFDAPGTGFEGESLEGSFDHVVAINYNREPGTTPLDWTRPLGADKGGGIWIHVDHGGPTQGCVSLPFDRMEQLLRWLDPAKRPVVVMGDVAALGE